MTEPVTPLIDDFQVNINDAVRPYPVLNTSDFITATTAAITDPALRQLAAVGGIDQLTQALIHFTPWPSHLTQTYCTLLEAAQYPLDVYGNKRFSSRGTVPPRVLSTRGLVG